MVSKKKDKGQEPITMAEWSENINLLRTRPDLFGIPEALVNYIKIYEYNDSIELEDGDTIDVLAFDIYLVTRMGATFAKETIYLTKELTKFEMLGDMCAIVLELVKKSGYTKDSPIDMEWANDEQIQALYESSKKYLIN